MSRVIHFEIPADDPERACNFYKDVFGWEIKKWDGPMEYWLVTTGDKAQPGIDGGIMKRENVTSVTNTIDVSSVEEFVEKIKSKGGQLVMPKTPVPGVGYFAYCKDTEGNLFGIMQADQSAK